MTESTDKGKVIATATVTRDGARWLLRFFDAKNRELFAAGYKSKAAGMRAANALMAANWLVIT